MAAAGAGGMTGAFVDGIRRVAAAPALLLGTGAFALPVVFLSGIFPWRSVHHLASSPPPNAFEAAVPLACAAAWTFLTGGVIERLARQRRVGGAGFFTACGVHFWRLIRLAVLAGVVYALLRGALHPWLLDAVLDALHGRPDGVLPETAVRRTLAGLIGVLAAGVTLVFDYARVRTVVEDRRSTIGALLAAGRFVRRRPAAVAGLWLLNAALAGVVLAAHDLAAPDPGAGTWPAFLIGLGHGAAQLFAALVVHASQTAYFQGQLAHATYVARARVPRPEPVSGRPA